MMWHQSMVNIHITIEDTKSISNGAVDGGKIYSQHSKAPNPPKHHLFSSSHFRKVSNVVTKRFMFDASNITRLRKKDVVESPTQDEAISAIMWKRFIELDQSRLCTTTTDCKHPYSAFYTVNLRRRRALLLLQSENMAFGICGHRHRWRPSTTLGFSLGSGDPPTRALVERFFGGGEGGGLVFDDGGGVVEEGAGGGRGGAVFGDDEGGGLVFFGALTVVLSKGAFGGSGGVIEGALALAEALA
ncbi:hypothetical protein Scep_029543 [Stephania cephalantha]|uniref:Uncharacterized protein n=1 Tax=Stephania cephalantha TaxID=152367 RepID=A0AAP0E2D5_9MAGN